jgi:hypothetical protein
MGPVRLFHQSRAGWQKTEVYRKGECFPAMTKKPEKTTKYCFDPHNHD